MPAEPADTAAGAGWLARAAPYIALTAAAAFWGGTWTAARGSYQDVSPAVMAFSRWAAAGAVLLPLLAASLWRHRAALRREWRTIVLLSAVGAIFFNYMIFRGTQTTTAINGALLNASVPIYIVLLSLAGVGERSTAGRIAGIAIALVGLVVVVAHGSWQRLTGLEFVEGDLWIAGAMFFWGLYTIGIRGWNSALPPLTGLAAIAAVSVLGLAPVAAVELAYDGRLVASAEAVYGILYVGVCGTAGAYVLWNYGIRRVGAAGGSLFLYLIPVFGAIFAVTILSEEIALYHLAGTALIVTGILVANREGGAPGP